MVGAPEKGYHHGALPGDALGRFYITACQFSVCWQRVPYLLPGHALQETFRRYRMPLSYQHRWVKYPPSRDQPAGLVDGWCGIVEHATRWWYGSLNVVERQRSLAHPAIGWRIM